MTNDVPELSLQTALEGPDSVSVIVENSTWATAEQLQELYEAFVSYSDEVRQVRDTMVELQGYMVGLLALIVGFAAAAYLFRRL